MTKRKIAPHKGARTERLTARLTPETMAALKALAASRELSQADVLSQLIRDAARREKIATN